MKDFQEIVSELKAHNIEVVRVPKTNPNTFQTWRVTGANFDPSKVWNAWQIRAAYKRGCLYLKEGDDMKKFDSRVRPGTKVQLTGYRVGWLTVTSVHPTRKWIQVDGYLGSFQREDVLKFSNKKPEEITSDFGEIIKELKEKRNGK